MLEKYVQVSIDEYKMEQEYQIFINTLRKYLEMKPSKISHLHLLIDEGITFLMNNMMRLSEESLRE